MNAEVRALHGRYHLVVNGVYVAMENDPCHDPWFFERHWTKATLDQAADMITHARWTSAADRDRRRER